MPDPDQTPPLATTKTDKLARETTNPVTLANAVGSAAAARDLLRSKHVIQAGSGARNMDRSKTEDLSLFYLDGEAHRRRRSTIAPFFTLKAIETRYQGIMDSTADQLIAEIAREGEVRLDKLAFQFAVAVAAEVLGLDHSDLPALTARIEATITTEQESQRPIKNTDDDAVQAYYRTDIQPAIDARRAAPGDDVISRLIDAGCSDTMIATEVRGYSFAGMVTTRELIVMSAWYLIERPELLARFRDAGKREQLAIVEEILRIEPIVGYIKRRAADDIAMPSCPHIAAGSTITIDVRRANTDEAVTGPCPERIDPERAGSSAPGSSFMSFGDGPHRCPGAQLALAEARTFLDRLVRLPGLRLVGEPRMAWFKAIASYVFLDAYVACDRRGGTDPVSA